MILTLYLCNIGFLFFFLSFLSLEFEVSFDEGMFVVDCKSQLRDVFLLTKTKKFDRFNRAVMVH